MGSSKYYLRQLCYFIHGYENWIILLFVIAVSIGLIDALSIALFYPMLSEGFQISADSIPFYHYIEWISSFIPIGSTFVHLGILFIFCTGLSLFLQLVYWKIAFIMQKEIIVGVKTRIFRKIDRNDYKFFVDTKQGDLINLFNQSPLYVQQTIDRLLSLCTELVTSIIVIGMLFVISPGGLLFVLVGGGLFYIVLNFIGNNISEKLGQLQIASGQSENKVINEYLNGIKLIKALHASGHWGSQYESALHIYWDKFSNFMFIQRIPIIAINSLFYISIGVIVLFLYIYYSDNFLAVIPVLGTFAAGMMKILPKFMNMGSYKLDLKNYLSHLSTVYAALHETRYHAITNGNLACDGITSDIVLDDICFSYGHHQILDHFSMKIKKGTICALAGPSGSGKSTIASLLLRLYDPVSGKIWVNGRDLKEFDIDSYRDIVGYVSQDPFVFNDTIRNNITFGGTFSDIEVIDAARLAHAHEFILGLPQGYDTPIGDQGITLSGGEKQRIVIARAMIRRPELLILDEATSALDNISEVAVQQAIDHVAKECTTLVIAHRLTTIRNADYIILVENGIIVDSGTHEVMIARKGKYWEMYTASNPV